MFLLLKGRQAFFLSRTEIQFICDIVKYLYNPYKCLIQVFFITKLKLTINMYQLRWLC